MFHTSWPYKFDQSICHYNCMYIYADLKRVLQKKKCLAQARLYKKKWNPNSIGHFYELTVSPNLLSAAFARYIIYTSII